MAILTLTARGQVTFCKEVLKHLGMKPGDQIEVELLPDGRLSVTAAQRTGTMDRFIGVLAGKTRKVASLDEVRMQPREDGLVCREDCGGHQHPGSRSGAR